MNECFCENPVPNCPVCMMVRVMLDLIAEANPAWKDVKVTDTGGVIIFEPAP